MFIRSGNLIDVSSYHFSIKYNDPEEAFSSFLNQFYNKNNFIPKEVIIPVKSKDKNILEEVLTELKGQKVDVIWPQRGEKLKLVQMAQKNAGNSLISPDNQEEKCHDILENVAKVLGLNSIPEPIECFDVSNINGEHAVGAMVVFKMGIPHKPAYRRYRIKGVTQSDDFAMMREILKRRYVRAQKMDNFPNLIIIDGGKGHTGVALNLFKELGIADLNVIGIAKGHKRNNTFDRVYLPDNNEPVDLKSDSSELLFIQKIRDEAHRFANTYHKKLRKKAQFAT